MEQLLSCQIEIWLILATMHYQYMSGCNWLYFVANKTI